MMRGSKSHSAKRDVVVVVVVVVSNLCDSPFACSLFLLPSSFPDIRY